MSGTRSVQRIAGIALAVLAVALVIDSIVLATAAVPSRLLGWVVGAHIWLGLALVLALPAFAFSHWVLHRRHRNTSARRAGLVVVSVATVGCIAGASLWLLGPTRTTRWLVIAHEGAFVAAVLAYVLHRLRATVTVALRPERVAAGIVAIAVAGIWAVQLGTSRGEAADESHVAFDGGLSQARPRDGHVLRPEDLANPEYCAGCHPSIAERWRGSAHRVASLNDPFYAATLANAQQRRTPEQLKFCGGCHDPQLLLTGRMDAHPKPGDPGADEGITCLACHAITETPGRLGNGSYVVAAPDHYPDHDADDPDARERSARLLRSKPEQHVASFGPSHLRSPELCLPCHKAHIPPELNGHRWLAGQNEYDAWHDSGAGGYSARTFYPPASPQKRCQDCHMPMIAADDPAATDGMVADHAFLGANTALPHALGDDEWLARSQKFLDGVVSIDVAAVEIDTGSEVIRQLAPTAVAEVPPAAPLTFDVVIRNRKSGHLFPGGIADLRETWLEATLVSDDGTTLVASGWLDAEGNLDPGAHRWNVVLLDGKSAPLRVHDVEDAHVVLTARRILLGASDVVRIAFDGPRTPAKLRLRVLHRKFPRDYVEFVLGPDAAPLPVTTIASAEISLRPVDVGAILRTTPATDAGPRLRDLGIGHLLRGDTSLAREAALLAAERLPQDPGPRLDLARGALDDGDLARAEAHVREADALSPGHPTAAWLLARIRAAQGDHEAALAALATALDKFPRDRELLVLQGDSLFRLGRDDAAADVLERVLEIDPEHVAAHALLTRIRSEQGDNAAAERHKAYWDRVRPHSEDRSLTELARRSDASLDRRANDQYVLPLLPPPSDWRTAAP